MQVIVREPETVPPSAHENHQRLVIYWDGQCPMCAAIKARFEPFDTNDRLIFVDLNDPAVAKSAAPRFSPDELAGSMRVRVPDGTWRSGYFAWSAVLSALPFWKWLGAVMNLWIFADIGPKVYAWVAAHRYGISRVLSLPRPCAADDACRSGAA